MTYDYRKCKIFLITDGKHKYVGFTIAKNLTNSLHTKRLYYRRFTQKKTNRIQPYFSIVGTETTNISVLEYFPCENSKEELSTFSLLKENRKKVELIWSGMKTYPSTLHPFTLTTTTIITMLK
jgi:hypothetical protein